MARDAKNTDEFFQRIHDAVPGFAGLTFEDGIPTVYLVDTDRVDLASSVLTPFFVARGRAGFRVREAKYSWAELYDWRKRARKMFDMPDLRSLGVSAVFWMGLNGKVNLAGIFWGALADTAFYSPLGNIEDDLGAYIDVITDSVPVLPTGVSISGPTSIRPDATCLWEGHVSNGTEPYSYLWENDTHDVGTTDSYVGGKLSGSSGSSFVLKFTVTNDAGQSYDQITVTEDSNAPICVM